MWKKLCLHLAIDFDLTETLSKECLKCLDFAMKIGLDKVEEDDVDSLLELIGEELSMEELDKLEKQWQWCQLKEEVKAEQHPTAPVTKKDDHQHSAGLLRTAEPGAGLHGGDGPRLRMGGTYEAKDADRGCSL